MATAQVVETSVTVNNNSTVQDYLLSDDHVTCEIAHVNFEETSLYKYICISLDGHSTLQKEKFTWKQIKITLTLLNKLCKIASGKKVRQRIKKKQQQQQQQRKERKKEK